MSKKHEITTKKHRKSRIDMKHTRVTIKQNKVNLYKINQCPLIEKEHMQSIPSLKEGTLIELATPQGEFIGTGYYGVQNKGIGWVLTQKQGELIDDTFFTKKIRTAIDKRRTFFDMVGTNVFRLFNGEGDGIGGLTIDYYDGILVITWYSEGIYSFRDSIISALEQPIPILDGIKGIYQKKRFNDKGQFVEESSFLKSEQAPEPLIVEENAVKYAVYLDDGAMTGIFLDQKDVRGRIKNHYAKDMTVLNTFSYTGAFSIAAAIGGAKSTTSVDLAKRSLSKTREQFLLNDIDLEGQDIVVMDVFDYFKWAIKKEKLYDIAILDPPAFAKSKKMIFTVRKDYTWLVENAIELTTENGLIIASTNSASLDMKHFKRQVSQAFMNKHCTYEIVETYTLPEDFVTAETFVRGNYLKVLFIRKLDR